VQALTLRLLVDQGELEALGHPRYGSRIRELLGARLDRANLELMRRIVRQTLLDDPRVAEVVRVVVQSRSDAPGIVDVDAEVRSRRRIRADRSEPRCQLKRLSTARTSPP
jgi:phage baseplate assembly protein W